MNQKSEFSRPFLFIFTAILIALATFHADAQNIRLRSNLDPIPGSSLSKYSDITGDGNLAVMGSFSTPSRGAFIFDISNPDAPVLKAHYNPGNNQQFLEAVVVGNRAYFGSGNGGGVHIVDLTNPASPQLLGIVNSATANAFNSVHEIVVDGDFLYENINPIADRRIKVINISNPSAPVFVRDITPNEIRWVHAVHIRNGRMYTSGWGNGSTPGLVEIYDVSNIGTQAPTLLGQVASGTNTHSTWTNEDASFLYVAREYFNGELAVYDIRNVAQPLLVKTIRADDLGINAVCPHNPVVKGDKLYVGWYQAGMQVFDISTPGDPKRVGQLDTYLPQFVQAEAERQAASLAMEPWDIVCGAENLMTQLPTAYNGNWTAYPLLGADKVLLSDLATGLHIADASSLTAAAPRSQNADFDGDGKADLASVNKTQGANLIWQIKRSSDNSLYGYAFGLPSDKVMPADYDGDGKTDIAVTRNNSADNRLYWYIINSSNNTFRAEQFGIANDDTPLAADYDSDGRADLAVWRRTNGVWYVNRSTLGFLAAQWGQNGDSPIRGGDFDADGKADFAVTRNQGDYKIWYILQSSSSIPVYKQFGLANDLVTTGDYDGDKRTDLAVYRRSNTPNNNVWYVAQSGSNDAMISRTFGGGIEDVPIEADYDGDGKIDFAVWRLNNGSWQILNSANNSTVNYFSSDEPVTTAY